jgi:hypothetical protein
MRQRDGKAHRQKHPASLVQGVEKGHLADYRNRMLAMMAPGLNQPETRYAVPAVYFMV